MIAAIADTHTAIWYLFSDPRLGRAASRFIDNTIAKGDHIGVSAISITEMIYLTEKGRISASALVDLQTATADPKVVLRYVPLDENIAMKMAEIPPPGRSRPSGSHYCRHGAIPRSTRLESRRADTFIKCSDYLVSVLSLVTRVDRAGSRSAPLSRTARFRRGLAGGPLLSRGFLLAVVFRHIPFAIRTR